MFVVSFVTQAHKMVKISILTILISHLFSTMVHVPLRARNILHIESDLRQLVYWDRLKFHLLQKMMNSI